MSAADSDPKQNKSSGNGSRSRLLLGAVGALLIAVVGVVGVILPAEYSLDPLGTGSALGLLGLADAGPQAVVLEGQVHSAEVVDLDLAPYESVEYSYRMNIGASMVYSWVASGEVVFNLHSSPDVTPIEGPADYAESFSAGRASGQQGTYTATFNGRHGWFWENRSNTPVRLRLATAGFVSAPLRASVSGEEAGQSQPVF